MSKPTPLQSSPVPCELDRDEAPPLVVALMLGLFAVEAGSAFAFLIWLL
jgi:hypothetical protein